MKRQIKVPKFVQVIQMDSLCHLAIQTPKQFGCDEWGHSLTDDDNRLPLSDITPKLLLLLANAYECGYEEGIYDAEEAVRRRLFENATPRKPQLRISEKIDYREA